MSISLGRILPIVVIDSADDAEPLAEALLAGGIRQVEVTLRTPAAIEAARRMARHDDLVVGVGTALTTDDVSRAADAGARFIVSPGLIEPVVERTLALGLASIPGIATATELARASAFGLDLLKVFPAEQLGGVAMIAALAAVFPEVRFMPSGGIGPTNAGAYLSHPAVTAIGGSWMAPREAIKARDFLSIADLCTAAGELLR
ncbi:bifunctional 4-hydroxy-2-oxoglutarate aldolase/2-dehydro-3-deoxy-phosphogluconate aldolase [Herbiconiux sp. CPCC 205763]|uniref:2-dehydro-3-deoxy-phosphogluconate aldolase n=1 Tax=Herbiconiux aconitum TaxID=2970913 RepID=A0ABT2GS92_9MICO|nr:bifunctional 4-hydroxy-2-oxoglutarate aldolase/2-dehydro-3-deoxy-phosphogluconate aldolase [Herbiconiux aconitum]MCS5717691.1 bifunctional 4-hydroxy-2-oxoglutarate aldolase/2-dehydro-3-deoxy-phosphogluconate aldolase [Herbiconiux aconitum]